MPDRIKEMQMAEIYDRYFPRIYNYVFYRLLHVQNTEDIVSQVFFKVYLYLDRFDPNKGSMKAWIMCITENVMIDFFRRQKQDVSYDNERFPSHPALLVQFDDLYERICSPKRKLLLDALRRLPERDHMFIYYRYYLDITNREIARIMNMNENTVSAALSRARKKLRIILEAEGM